MVILKLKYASQDWESLSNFKPQSLYFHSNLNYKTDLPKVYKPVFAEQNSEKWGGQEAFNTLIFIKENYNEVIQKNPSILVFFFAEWCSHCKQMKEVFGKTALKAFKGALPIKFAFVDVNIKPEIAEEHGVVGIPLIKYYKDGKFISNYKGKRTVDDLYKFAQNPPTTFIESTEADY